MKRIAPFLVLILILGVVGISGCTSSGSSSGMSSADIKAQAQTVTAAQLWADRGALVGKPVKMKGEITSIQSSQIQMKGIAMSYGYNTDDHDVLGTGKFSNVTAYENDEAWIYGIFQGQVSYTTVMGAERKVPGINNAWIEPTGKTYK